MSRHRILVIGGGSIGERHARCFVRTGRADVLLCEPRSEVRERIQATYGLSASFASLDEAMRQPFDAAVICSPAHLHIAMARQLVARRIATLIEKPLGVNLDGAFELVTEAAASGTVMAVAYVYRCFPVVEAVRGLLATGELGRIVEIVAVCGQHFPLYRPAYREIYYNRHETGGGAIQDALTHVMNAGEWLVGPVTGAFADAAHCVLEGVDVEDTVHVVARHGGVLGAYALNQHQPPNEITIKVVCERGAVRAEIHNARWLTCCEPGAAWEVQETFTNERDDAFVRQAELFLDCVEGRSPPRCSLAEGLQTLRVNLALLESARSRQWVALGPPPKAHEPDRP
jgi:predicted dehydrogenase